MLSRRKSRILVVQALYSWEYGGQDIEPLSTFPWYEYSGEKRAEHLYFPSLLLTSIMEKLSEIDKLIRDKLEHWEFERLGKVELAILRMGVYELLFSREIPRQVVIDEAIEIANTLTSSQTFRIINGVLDSIRPEDQ